jgi:adenosylhomocysteine nucleosidase
VGKVQAATKLAHKIGSYKHNNVTEVWNYGTAGGVNPSISGLTEIHEFTQRDMNAEPIEPRGNVPYSNPLLGNIKTSSFRNDRSFTNVRCGTGDNFVTSPDKWFTDENIDCVDMEGYALAYVCQYYEIKFRSWKYISDMANENASKDWKINCDKGAESFKEIHVI